MDTFQRSKLDWVLLSNTEKCQIGEFDLVRLWTPSMAMIDKTSPSDEANLWVQSPL